MPAATGNCATSPHALRTTATVENNSERLGFMSMAPGFRLMLHRRASHLAATFCTVHAGLDAFVHIADAFAILAAGVADFGADSAKTIMESGTA
jgi:hypothetical protein